MGLGNVPLPVTCDIVGGPWLPGLPGAPPGSAKIGLSAARRGVVGAVLRKPLTSVALAGVIVVFVSSGAGVVRAPPIASPTKR